MTEVLHELLYDVIGVYNMAYAAVLVAFLSRLGVAAADRAARLSTFVRRYLVALGLVWALGILTDAIFPNSIAWTILPAVACACVFRDLPLPLRVARTSLAMCSWMYSLAIAEATTRALGGGIVVAGLVSLVYVLGMLAIVMGFERQEALDEGTVNMTSVIPVLVVCASGLAARAILILRSDFGVSPYSVSTLESLLTCFNGQIAELVVWWAILRQLREVAERDRLVAERRVMASRMEAMEAYRANADSLHKLRHEVKNQYAYIRMLLERGDYQKAQEFFGQMSMSANPTFSRVNSGNQLVDDIVNLELDKARNAGVTVNSRIAVPAALPVEEIDLCSLLMNMLDNAIEACADDGPKEPGKRGTDPKDAEPKDTGDKTIDLRMVLDQGALVVVVANPAAQAPDVAADGRLRTTKGDEDLHGYGTSVIRSVAEKYHGLTDFSFADGVFTAKAMLVVS